jgi:transposase InsO family protein
MRLERFWRTLKELLGLRFRRPLLKEDLERRVAYALAFYALFRPHQGLMGATPL